MYIILCVRIISSLKKQLLETPCPESLFYLHRYEKFSRARSSSLRHGPLRIVPISQTRARWGSAIPGIIARLLPGGRGRRLGPEGGRKSRALTGQRRPRGL